MIYIQTKIYYAGEFDWGLSLDAFSTTGVYLDDITANWKLVGIRSSQIIISSRNKQSVFVQLDDVTDNLNLAGSRSSQIEMLIDIQTK